MQEESLMGNAFVTRVQCCREERDCSKSVYVSEGNVSSA